MLVTDKGMNLLDGISSDDQSQFQTNLAELVRKCTSLLTVEQLMDLVQQMKREEIAKQEKTKIELLKALNNQSNSPKVLLLPTQVFQ